MQEKEHTYCSSAGICLGRRLWEAVWPFQKHPDRSGAWEQPQYNQCVICRPLGSVGVVLDLSGGNEGGLVNTDDPCSSEWLIWCFPSILRLWRVRPAPRSQTSVRWLGLKVPKINHVTCAPLFVCFVQAHSQATSFPNQHGWGEGPFCHFPRAARCQGPRSAIADHRVSKWMPSNRLGSWCR